jgi:UDP-glucose 4-epimerase
VVTGGAGFIGSHLVDALLAQGWSVVVVDNLSTGRRSNLSPAWGHPKFQFHEADIRAFDAIAPLFDRDDCVFHLAALADIVPSIQRPIAYYRANVDGTLSVLEAARAAGAARFVYIASSSCYGVPDRYPTPETADLRPQYPYALTKLLGEQLVMHWAQVYKLPAVSLRLFNVFGPRARSAGSYGAVFGVFLAQKLAGRPFTVVGDGTQTRDFTYVSDAVEAIMQAAASSWTNTVFNVGSGATYSINRLVELLGGEIVYIPRRPGEPDCTFADTRKIREALPWRPRVTFEHGVRSMLERIEDWRDAPVWDPQSISEATREWFTYLDRSVSGPATDRATDA